MSLAVSPDMLEQARRESDAAHARADFVTARSQILNQRPELVDC